MKILGIVLAVLMLSASAFVGYLGSTKAGDAATMIGALADGMTDADKKALEQSELGEGLPSAGRLNAGRIAGVVGAAAAVLLLVVMFARKQLVLAVAAATVVVTAVSAAIYPYFETGPLDGMAPRTQAMVAAGLAVVGAAGAWLAARRPGGAVAGTTATVAA